jgi:hypothetical protein
MALYKNGDYLQHSTDSAFDGYRSPGDTIPHSGIYRCIGCGREVVAEESRKLPPQNHHQHTVGQGEIRWRLIVYANHKPQ